MLIDELKNYSAACFRDCPPPCTSACPLGLDVRALIEKVRRKNFTAAYRLYRNQALFPAIVSRICDQPCREKCVRAGADRAVALRAIEAACVAHTKDDRAVAFNVPAKPFTVAIIGAGLSGLSCALKLTSRNYRVNIYDQAERLGGRLEEALPPELIQAELEKQFHGLEYRFFPSGRIDDLSALEADAVYLATGRDGSDFGLKEGLDPQSLGSRRAGVFLGGELLGASRIEAIEHGIRASFSIEKYLKVGAMDGIESTYLRPSSNDNFYLLPIKGEAGGPEITDEPLSPDQTLAESGRCLRCNCEMCRDNCDMMRAFKTLPPKMTTDAIASVGSRESITNRVGMKMINACSQCGLCRRVCPEAVDMELCLLEARRLMHKEKVMPPAYHDFWLRDMNFSNQEAYLVYRPAGVTASSLVFFPGCQLGASDPAYVFKTYEYLSGQYPDLALILSCCGVPADWAGDERLRAEALERIKADWDKLGRPTIILACPTCRKTFSRYLPEAPTVSLYEVLAENPPPGLEAAPSAEPLAVFDPCASRGDPAMQAGVRRLIRAWGGQVAELPHHGELARCCGFGGHIQAVRQDLVDDIVADRISRSEHEYLTYCTNCRDIFAVSGKPARHVLDLLFTDGPADRRPPALGQRRKNRMILKRSFAASQMGLSSADERSGRGWPSGSRLSPSTCQGGRPESESQEPETMKLLISEELQAKMDRLLILEEEIRAVVAHCESGPKLLDPQTGIYSGHLKIGFITYWVSYVRAEGSFRLVNVYSHRMTIENETPGEEGK